MNVIVRTTAKLMFPVILLFGIYITLHGHITPGGSFSGGTIMAAGFILLTLASGIERTEKELKESVVDILKSVAGLALVVLVIFEFLLRRAIVPIESIFSLFSGGPLLPLNITGGVMVFTGLLMIWYTAVKTDMEREEI